MHTLWFLSADQSLEILGFTLLLITDVIMVSSYESWPVPWLPV